MNHRHRSDDAPSDERPAARPSPPVARSLALALALPVAALVLMHPLGPVLLAAAAVSAVFLAQVR
ncbi:MAG: hypothetical protein ABEJ76_05865 [Halanaeroarchaeum sp.]